MISDNENVNCRKRFTKQRQYILDIVRNTKIHPDANWIYTKIVKEIPKISLGTIYRNLGILSKEKLIKEIAFQPNITRYEGDLTSHHHIMCLKCYKIEDVDIDIEHITDETIKKKISQSLNYENICCEILFTGICSKCQANKETENN